VGCWSHSILPPRAREWTRRTEMSGNLGGQSMARPPRCWPATVVCVEQSEPPPEAVTRRTGARDHPLAPGPRGPGGGSPRAFARSYTRKTPSTGRARISRLSARCLSSSAAHLLHTQPYRGFSVKHRPPQRSQGWSMPSSCWASERRARPRSRFREGTSSTP
jgi:hypothetical protein